MEELVVDVAEDLRRRRRLVLLAVERRAWALVRTPLCRCHSGRERRRMVCLVFAKPIGASAGAASRDCMTSCTRRGRLTRSVEADDEFMFAAG